MNTHSKRQVYRNLSEYLCMFSNMLPGVHVRRLDRELFTPSPITLIAPRIIRDSIPRPGKGGVGGQRAIAMCISSLTWKTRWAGDLASFREHEELQ